jgi:hypothetical protein
LNENENKINGMNFNDLKAKYKQKKEELEKSKSKYISIKNEIDKRVTSMEREKLPYTENMSDASFNNFKKVINQYLLQLLDTGLQLLDTGSVEPKPA